MLPSFTAGELSPNLYARVDLDKYHSGVSQGRNMFVDYRGGMSNRPGTKFLAKALSNIYSRIIPFIVSRDVSYIVEFAHLQLRIFANGVPVATLTAPLG